MRCVLRVSVSVVLWLAVAAFAVSLHTQSPAQVLLPMRVVANMGEPKAAMPVSGGQLTPLPSQLDYNMTPKLSTDTYRAAAGTSGDLAMNVLLGFPQFTTPQRGEFETTAEYDARYQRALQEYNKAFQEERQRRFNRIFTEEVRVYLQYDADQEEYKIRPCGFILGPQEGFGNMEVRNPITANNPGIVVVNDVAMHGPITAINQVSGQWFIGVDCSVHVGRAEAPQWRANAETLRLRFSFRVGPLDQRGRRGPAVPIYVRELELYFVSFGGTARTLFLWRAD